MDVKPSHPAHLFPVYPVALFPDHLHDGCFVLVGPHDGADADLAHDACHLASLLNLPFSYHCLKSGNGFLNLSRFIGIGQLVGRGTKA
jgi:hypothetical protein